MDAFFAFAGKPLGAFAGLVGVAASLDTGSVFLVVGAIIYSLAVWRSKSRDVLRQENQDISARNTTLEADASRLNARVNELSSRPDLDGLALLVDALLTRVENHDLHMKELAAQQAEGWKEIVGLLREIRRDVSPVRDEK